MDYLKKDKKKPNKKTQGKSFHILNAVVLTDVSFTEAYSLISGSSFFPPSSVYKAGLIFHVSEM